MTDNKPTAELATNGDAIVLPAIRRERRWITPAGAHGVVVHGRTLSELQASARQALALRFGTPTAPPVQVRPQSAELDTLAEARLRYDTALRHAVQTLRADGTSWTDIAQACHVRIADAQSCFAKTQADASAAQ
ncbi:hypothetical protein [Microbispora sp. NBRC 16548]|uniref:hypothetical protein n=1 Tax=Microbispora sp. NBRC 16548 TaxID=3030994 RepID=UPI0024A0BF63|nr:hypothetical protein [Microbispora sp. NBRC 16548]GLX06587.1 hypothetical protein Misp03_35140 [Microbispora sp. NBRC 16548]